MTEYKKISPLESKVFFAFAVFVGIMFVAFGILAFSSTISLIRLRINSGNFTKNCEQCSETSVEFKNNNDTYSGYNTNHSAIKNEMENITKTLASQVGQLNDEVTKLLLSDYIIDEKKITELESDVKEGARIVVMTSKFHLDKGKLVHIILENIRRGVEYQYLVPGEKTREGSITGTNHRDFCQVVKGWWAQFKSDINTYKDINEIEGKNYCSDYNEVAKKAINGDGDRNEIFKETLRYFENHVKEYLISKNHSLVTVIMYQQEPAPSSEWEIIIKLPTVTDNNYYAFKIPQEKGEEKTNLINSIESFCSERNIVNLKGLS
jgi:hypothetical protein